MFQSDLIDNYFTALQPKRHVAGVFEPRRCKRTSRDASPRGAAQAALENAPKRRAGPICSEAEIRRFHATALGEVFAVWVRYVPSGVVIFGREILDLGGVDGTSRRTSARRLVRGPNKNTKTLQRWCEGTGR